MLAVNRVIRLNARGTDLVRKFLRKNEHSLPKSVKYGINTLAFMKKVVGGVINLITSFTVFVLMARYIERSYDWFVPRGVPLFYSADSDMMISYYALLFLSFIQILVLACLTLRI